jgi:hypothetical protein
MDQALVECTAQRMISSGMAAAGYRYMNIDDCWMAPSRDRQDACAPTRTAYQHRISAPHISTAQSTARRHRHRPRDRDSRRSPRLT